MGESALLYKQKYKQGKKESSETENIKKKAADIYFPPHSVGVISQT